MLSVKMSYIPLSEWYPFLTMNDYEVVLILNDKIYVSEIKWELLNDPIITVIEYGLYSSGIKYLHTRWHKVVVNEGDTIID